MIILLIDWLLDCCCFDGKKGDQVNDQRFLLMRYYLNGEIGGQPGDAGRFHVLGVTV